MVTKEEAAGEDEHACRGVIGPQWSSVCPSTWSYEYCELDQEDVAHSEAPLPSSETTGNTGQGDQNRFYTNPGKPSLGLARECFLYRGTKLFNLLSDDMKQESNMEQFKTVSKAENSS